MYQNVDPFKFTSKFCLQNGTVGFKGTSAAAADAPPSITKTGMYAAQHKATLRIQEPRKKQASAVRSSSSYDKNRKARQHIRHEWHKRPRRDPSEMGDTNGPGVTRTTQSESSDPRDTRVPHMRPFVLTQMPRTWQGHDRISQNVTATRPKNRSKAAETLGILTTYSGQKSDRKYSPESERRQMKTQQQKQQNKTTKKNHGLPPPSHLWDIDNEVDLSVLDVLHDVGEGGAVQRRRVARASAVLGLRQRLGGHLHAGRGCIFVSARAFTLSRRFAVSGEDQQCRFIEKKQKSTMSRQSVGCTSLHVS